MFGGAQRGPGARDGAAPGASPAGKQPGLSSPRAVDTADRAVIGWAANGQEWFGTARPGGQQDPAGCARSVRP